MSGGVSGGSSLTRLGASGDSPGAVVVTGASRGVGRATAFAFAARGIRPVLLGRASARLDHTAAELASAGASPLVVTADLALRSEVDAASQRILAAVGAPLAVVHAAGIVERASTTEVDDASWDRQLEVNLTAPLRLTRALLPRMLESGRGRVLFVSSISATLGTARQAAYNASKAGLVAAMRCLAEELSQTALMTAAVLPGSIDTDMLVGSGYAPRMTAEEVAGTLVFLGLDASRAHNGAAIEMFGV